MHFSRLAQTTLLASLLLPYTAQAEESRHHGKHEHGVGQLNVSVEKSSMMIELILPAMNVVGFEYSAKTDEERKQIKQAVVTLKDGLTLFSPSAAAKCRLIDADVASALIENDHDEHEKHAGHDDHAEHGKHDGHAEHEERESHADFEVVYAFKCDAASSLGALTLSVFDHLPGVEHLETQLITANGQTGTELTAKNNVLNLNIK